MDQPFCVEGTMEKEANRRWWVDFLIAVIAAALGGGIGVGGTIYLTHEERQENKQKQRQLDERQAKAEAWMTHLADGSYEWQWAPEGWLGTIDIATSSKGDKSAMINIEPSVLRCHCRQVLSGQLATFGESA